ncbi:hypothetical protein ABT381_14605 [Streptomyces sp. NPDC000151]
MATATDQFPRGSMIAYSMIVFPHSVIASAEKQKTPVAMTGVFFP